MAKTQIMIKAQINLPGILTDSEEEYVQKLHLIAEHADTESFLRIDRNLSNGITVRLLPSVPEFKERVLKNVLGVHRLLGMKALMSKSTTLSPSIIFTVEF